MKRYLLSIIVLSLFSLQTKAQVDSLLDFIRMDSIEVIRYGVTLNNPWSGGLNNPQYSTIDLNFDGHKDLFIFDPYAKVFKTYLNDGISGTVSYTYAPQYQRLFPDYNDLSGWVLLRDYNCDGLEDIFAYVPGGISLYKNVGNATIGHRWELVTNLLMTSAFGQQSNVYCTINDIPSIEDMDGDGDLDILGPNVGGITYYRYQNVSTTCDTLIFERDNNCWGSFYESALNDSIILNGACKGGNSTSAPLRHANSTLLTVDLNGDSLVDLFIGDTESNSINVLYNGGTSSLDHMTSIEYNYPNNTIPIDLNEFVATYYFDANNDGVKDLIAAPTYVYRSDDVDNSLYYRNNGSTNNVNFSFVRRNFVNGEAVDLGTLSYPTFVDVDQDGLVDILSGNYGYFQSYNSNYVPTFLGQLAYFKNVGDSIAPVFELQTLDFNNLSNDSLDGFFPTFGDLDNDGDLDMIVGTSNGDLHYYVNNASPGSLPNFVLQEANYKSINNGPMATPKLYDVNNDGRLDLIIGETNGNLNLHLNVGSASSANFSYNPTNSSFGGFQHYNAYFEKGFVTVDFATIDSTNNLYAFVGTVSGKIYVYEDISNNLQSGNFTLVDSIQSSGRMVAPSVANINFTASKELIIGEGGGGFSLMGIYYEGSGDITDTNIVDTSIVDTTGIDEINKVLNDVNIFPNPAQDELTVEFNALENAQVNYQLTDLSGKSIVVGKWTITPGNRVQYKIDVKDISDGVYLIVIQSGNEHTVKKLIKN